MISSSIRPICVEDLPQILAIESKANPQPWSESSLWEEFAKPHSHALALTDDETDEWLLGFVLFTFIEGRAHILEIAVEPRLQGQGFGAKLLRAVVNHVLKHKGESIYLEVRKPNAGAIKFYQKMGFIVVHSKANYYSNGDDAYAMLFDVRAIPEQEE